MLDSENNSIPAPLLLLLPLLVFSAISKRSFATDPLSIDQAVDEVRVDTEAAANSAAESLGIRAYRYDAEDSEKFLPFRLYQPHIHPHQDPRAVDQPKKVPIVLWLHGQGAGGANTGKNINMKLANLLIGANRINKESCFLMFPQFQVGYNWWHYSDSKRGDQKGIAAVHVLELIDKMCEKMPNVDPERIYLLGMSQGSLAQNIWFAAYQNRFAGSVQFAGSNPSSHLPKDALVPTWVFYSTDDRVAMQSNITEDFIRKMRGWDQEKIKVTQYTDAGHGGTLRRALQDPEWVDWLFSQRNHKKPKIDQEIWDWVFYGIE